MYLQRAIEWFSHLYNIYSNRKEPLAITISRILYKGWPSSGNGAVGQPVAVPLLWTGSDWPTGQNRSGCQVGWSCRGCSSDPWMQHGMWHTACWNPEPPVGIPSRLSIILLGRLLGCSWEIQADEKDWSPYFPCRRTSWPPSSVSDLAGWKCGRTGRTAGWHAGSISATRAPSCRLRWLRWLRFYWLLVWMREER